MVFPDQWKIAHVMALFKKGDKSLPSNYRPVSLLSCVSKILEKIVYKQIYNHLHKNKLLYKFQSGFLPGYSTTHQLIELYDNIVLALDKKHQYKCHQQIVCQSQSYCLLRHLLKLERAMDPRPTLGAHQPLIPPVLDIASLITTRCFRLER
jgi:hypothetical protein